VVTENLDAFVNLRLEPPEDGAEPCEFRLDPARSYAWEDGSFPFLLAADSSAELVGAGIIGYMRATAFVAPGVGKRERAAIIRMQVEQNARQAE
jgi:hypothetical protein